MDRRIRLLRAIAAIDEALILNLAQNLRTPFFEDPNTDANLIATYRSNDSDGIAKWEDDNPRWSLVKLTRSASHIVFSLKKESFWSEDLIPSIKDHYVRKYGFKEAKIGIKGPVVVCCLYCDNMHCPSKETMEKVYGNVEENPLLVERDEMYEAFCDTKMEVLGVHRCDKYEKVDKAIVYEGKHGLPLVWCFRVKTKAPLCTENLEKLIRDTARDTYFSLCFNPVYYKREWVRAGVPSRQRYDCNALIEKNSFLRVSYGYNGKDKGQTTIDVADYHLKLDSQQDGSVSWSFPMVVPIGLDEDTLETLVKVAAIRSL